MSITVRGETIISGGTTGGNTPSVSDNLILYLDAANYQSYPGSGNIWTDLTAYQNNTSLVNSPLYNSDASGNIYFDNIQSTPFLEKHADFAVDLTGIDFITVEIWCNIMSKTSNGAGSYSLLFGWDLYNVLLISGVGLGYVTFNSDLYGISDSDINNLDLIGNWRHYVFTMKGSSTYTNNKIYVNGTSQTLTQLLPSPNNANINFNNGLGRISGTRSSSTYASDAKYSVFKIYNRELSQSEIIITQIYFLKLYNFE